MTGADAMFQQSLSGDRRLSLMEMLQVAEESRAQVLAQKRYQAMRTGMNQSRALILAAIPAAGQLERHNLELAIGALDTALNRLIDAEEDSRA